MSTDPTAPDFVYDEFAYLADNAREVGVPNDSSPAVARVQIALPDGRKLSALRWGTTDVEVVFIHGGSQNAHTWDTVCLALGRPALCVDLAGHGHSDWKAEQDYHPHRLADDVAVAVAEMAPRAQLVVGMSLGGMTANALAARHPQLVRQLLIVDVTPGTTSEKAKAIIDFVSGPQTFPTFAEILARTIQYNPTRTESSLRRGIVHNARRLDDGSWAWRYDRRERNRNGAEAGENERSVGGEARSGGEVERQRAGLWEDVSATTQPYLLVRGGAEGTVVDDADVAELMRRRPDAKVVTVPDAGHSIQGDQPLALAELIAGQLG